MKILHTVQGYFPYIGGSEELIRKISEGMVKMGHEVTVFTSYDHTRGYDTLNGVKIQQFKIGGNAVRGIKGDKNKYIDAVCKGNYDIMLNYAAQTWATDLLLPHLDKIKFKKILAPVGYSGLSSRHYRKYFESLPYYLKNYDCLLYHSANYQDKIFGDTHGLDKTVIIPNFADGLEIVENNIEFKEKYNISNKHLLLTVANHYKDKGHSFVIDAFLKANLPDAILVIIGNPTNKLKLYSDCYYECKIRESVNNGKIRILTNVPRADVIGAYRAADLFLFGSKVECSPLVIFEAMASRTPWISTNVGNLSELKNGVIVKDRADMAEKISIYLNDASKMNDAADAAYNEWQLNYGFEKILRQYLAIYEKLLSL